MNESAESAAYTRKLLEKLGSLDSNSLERSMETLMGNMNRNRGHVIARFQKLYEELEKQIDPNVSLVHFNPPDNLMKRKAIESEKKSTEGLIPLGINEMVVNTTHHGRFLRGTFIVEPLVMRSVQTIIEDEYSEIVNVSIYSKNIDSWPQHRKWEYAKNTYRRGKKVLILEPFYKVAMDGSLMIRVDNPNEIVEIQSFPSNSLEIKEEANRMFAAQSYSSAMKRYDEAMEVLKEIDTYRAIFQNLSLVHLKMSQLEHSLQYAVAAVSCGGSNEKAYFRLALTLDAMGIKNASFFCCNTVKDSEMAKNDKGFQALFNSLKKYASPIESLWEDESIVKAMTVNAPCVRLLGKTTAYELKQLGNDCVQAKLYEQAQVHYEQAILELEANSPVPLATLMCNKAICWVHLGNFALAVKEATCALLLDPFYVKALYNRSESLINLGWMAEAAATIEYAQNILGPECRSFDELKRRLVGKPCANKHYDEGDDDGGYMNLELLSQMNQMIDLFGKGKLKNLDIPNFCETYIQTKPWPKAADPVSCKRILKEAYEYARSTSSEFSFTRGITDEKDIWKRVGSNHPNDLMWYHSAPIGDIRYRPRFRFGMGMVHQSFGNVAQIPLELRGATTHVAFGFADLQELCIADLTSCSPQSPLKWIGYDMSPYVIAKTTVLLEMMKSGHSEAVVQVWYSTAWTRETLSQFLKALTNVLKVVFNS